MALTRELLVLRCRICGGVLGTARHGRYRHKLWRWMFAGADTRVVCLAADELPRTICRHSTEKESPWLA